MNDNLNKKLGLVVNAYATKISGVGTPVVQHLNYNNADGRRRKGRRN